jgi:predicted porin
MLEETIMTTKTHLSERLPLRITLLAAAALPALSQAAAVQVLDQVTNPEQAIHKPLELYGALRLSVDYSDADVTADEADANPLLSDGDLSVSSNTSMFGFRGEVPLDDRYMFLWQYEQQVDIDDDDPGDVWTTRDSFLGLESPAGTFLVGQINTPFKNMGVQYLGYFNTTIADTHAILGAAANGSGARLDLLGANSLNWKIKKGDVSMALQYAADQEGSIKSVDDNDRASYSGWLRWQPGPLDMNAAFINYQNFFGSGDLNAYRGSVRYHLGPMVLSGLYEDVQPENFASLDREAYGLQLFYTVVPRWTLAAQWNHAQESEAGDDDADQYSLGVFHALNDRVLVHAMATTTKNGENAAYKGVDYAHGDKLATLANRDPWSVSLGAQLKF